MKTTSATLAVVGWLAGAQLWAVEPAPQGLLQAVRSGNAAAARAQLDAGASVFARDPLGNTPLHLAALRGDPGIVALLLEKGAAVNATNQAGATPLLYGAHSAAIVHALLNHGANPNIASVLGSTPLMAAVMRPDSFGAVRDLVAHEADIRARRGWEPPGQGASGLGGGEQALSWAIAGGDRRTIRFLIEHGASINPTNSFSPIESAALYGDLPTAQRLLDLGANPNSMAAAGGVGNKAGPPLNTALFADYPKVALLLIERGADVNQHSPIGQGTSPAVFSAYSESGDDTVARALKAKGVDLNAPNDAGETAWSYALKRGGNTPLALWLQQSGLTNASGHVRTKSMPDRMVPSEAAARQAMIRDPAQQAIRALERSSSAFIESGVAQAQSQCVSCHQQSLPEVALGLARERGLAVDASDLNRLLAAHDRFWRNSAEAARQLLEPQPDAANNLGWGLQGLHALRYAPDDLTEAMVHYLLLTQGADGSWRTYDRRPPIQDGPLVGTALAARAVQLYPIPGREAELAEALRKAKGWLSQATPKTHNERVFQLLGLSWCGQAPSMLRPQVEALLADQRNDGGWAQLPGRDCDAWATGQALVALYDAGGVPTSHLAYQRGIEFLLRTQFEDGSWWVKSRSWPFQPHFDSQFPHGKDQWISAAGTGWAAMALLLTIEPASLRNSFPTAQQLMAAAPSSGSAPATMKLVKASPVSSRAVVHFTPEIAPMLERSCLSCHSGQKPKGGFDLSTRDHALKGGQSGEPALVPSQPERSALLRFVQDQVEDLEMPPLAKRSKYPPLSREEIAKLEDWIVQGAAWPAEVILRAPGQK
jgi:ankyrin repeat protein